MSDPKGSADEPRPLSWGERQRQRRDRQRRREPGVLGRAVDRLARRCGRWSRSLGLTRRKIHVRGAVYRELSAVPLRRALSPTGSGVKEYEVRFTPRGEAMESQQYPARESMKIRYTHRRIYADLGHEPRIRLVQIMRRVVRPGDRVLDLGCGTGASSAMLASLVGPSGGVVAIDRDGESIRFARQRYRSNHLAFELGWAETLEGELDGAFDAVMVVDLFRDAPDEPSKSRAIASLWRILRPGGAVLFVSTHRNRLDGVTDRLAGLEAKTIKLIDPDPVLLWAGALARKPDPRQMSGHGERDES